MLAIMFNGVSDFFLTVLLTFSLSSSGGILCSDQYQIFCVLFVSCACSNIMLMSYYAILYLESYSFTYTE